MEQKVYMHCVRNHLLHSFHSKLNIKKVDCVLSSKYLLSQRKQGEPYSYSFSGLDYISLCDYEKRNMTNSGKPYYNAYYSYIRRGISFAFDKKLMDEKYKVVIPNLLEGINKKDVFTYMEMYGNSKERYSDLPDEVQIRDKIALKDISYITYPCNEFFVSRIFVGKDSKRKNLIKELTELRNILLSNGYNLDIYDIDREILLDEEGIEKVLSLTK